MTNYSKEIKNQVINRYKNGESVSSIVKDSSPCNSTINRWIKEAGVARHTKSKTRLTRERKDKIIKLFNKGYNTVQIGEKLGFHPSTVGRFLNKNEIKPRGNKITISPEKEKEICRLYKREFKTAEEITDLFSSKIKSSNTIIKILRKNNVKIREAKRRIDIENKDFFEVIDNKYKAYILGFIIADGCIINHKDRDEKINRQDGLDITINKKDDYLLKRMKRIIGINSRQLIYSRNEVRLSLASDKIVTDLKKYGVVKRKSFKTFLPNIASDLKVHLVRGIFDGDGTVYIRENRYLTFGFYGTNRLISQIHQLLKEKINVNDNSIFDKKSVSFICYGSEKDVCNFYNYVYENADIYLKRKKKKFDQYLAD